MNRVFISLCFLVTYLLSPSLLYSQGNGDFEVADWPDFRTAAVSYTFDDGCRGQFSQAVPMFDSLGFNLTLFVVSSWVKDWEELQRVAASGHEVACHTATHRHLSAMSVAEQKEEFVQSTGQLENFIPEQRCLTMATPYCDPGDEALEAQYFIAVRGCQGFIEGSTPENFMQVSSVICGNLGPVNTPEQFTGYVERAVASSGWLVYLLHGIDDDGGYSPVSSQTLRASLEYLHKNREHIWVATFGEVAKYIQERDALQITQIAETDNYLDFSLTDSLPNEVFNSPLTLSFSLPEGWTGARVYLDGKELMSSLKESAGLKKLQFSVVPDTGTLRIRKAEDLAVAFRP